MSATGACDWWTEALGAWESSIEHHLPLRALCEAVELDRTALTLLMPGSVTPSGTSGRPYTNGNREQSNNFLLDGVDINETIDNIVGAILDDGKK